MIAGSAAAGVLPRDTVAVRSVRARPPRLLGRGDLAFLGGAAVAVAWAAHNDLWLTDETIEAHSGAENRLAAALQPLGNAGVAVPALAASYCIAHWSHHDEAAHVVLRVGAAVGVAGAVTLALKEAVGRSRPSESPDDPTRFRPFSGHASFPSGHATVAFAAATAIDEETSARWVPWVAFPTAALLGWSRVHQDEHWTSDVLAGAAVGFWVARKADLWLRSRDPRRSRLSLEFVPGSRSALVLLRFSPGAVRGRRE